MTDIEFFKENGYVVFRKAIEDDLIDRFWSSVDDNTRTNPALTFAVHGKLMTGAELRASASGGPVWLRASSGETLRIVDIESHSSIAPDLMLHPTIASFLASWYGTDPTAIQTLTYTYGSQQGAHSDLLLVEPPTVGRDYARATLAASWIACEEADDGNGPLVVYPGSHRLAKKRLVEDFSGDYAEYVSHLQQICAEAGIAGKTFHAGKGDVLFWHGDLVHAGAVISDPSRTRKSLVTHYAKVPAQAESVSPEFRRISRRGGWYYVRTSSTQ